MSMFLSYYGHAVYGRIEMVPSIAQNHTKANKPQPQAPMIAQGYQCYGRIRTCYMPINSGMVPLPQPFFPYRMSREGMIDGRRDITEKHPDKI